jgi:serine/threonine protein phosphatase PrpC
MSVNLLPNDAEDMADSKAGNPREDPRGNHNPEEIPEAANELTARQALAEQAPRKRRGADESDEKSDVRREILYRGPAEMIELRENLRPLLLYKLNLRRFGHLACSVTQRRADSSSAFRKPYAHSRGTPWPTLPETKRAIRLDAHRTFRFAAVTNTGEFTIPEIARRPRDNELDVFGLTHTGKIRKNNEDHFLICALKKQVEVYHTSLPDPSILANSQRVAMMALVADGVGGAKAGEEASRIALEHVTRYVTEALECYYTSDPNDDSLFITELEEAALKVHSEIAVEAATDTSRHGMATTLTLWLGIWPNAYLLQVGDSRCYSYRDGELIQMSRDQTMAEEFVKQGVFNREDAAFKRWANVLSSAIGGPQAAPSVSKVPQSWGSVGLLCSDGLTRHVSDERIKEVLSTIKSAKEGCETLLKDALDAGGEDNITVLIGRAVPHGDS